MNLKDLVPASQCAKNMGVKSVLYGGPGVGKTPLIDTAPSPVLLAIEPGMLSMRSSSVLTYKAYEHPKGVAEGVEEFFQWFFSSTEANKFDSLGVDSVSEMAEAFLRQELARNTNKQRAYGEMASRVTNHMIRLFYLPRKHVMMIAKQFEDKETKRKKPSFPGQKLDTDIPHLFDEIWHYSKLPIGSIPGVMEEVKAIRCHESADVMARDRSGNLDTFEFPNLSQIFNKCMQTTR